MKKIILSEYNAIPENYRGIWIVERWDLPDWAEIREKHIGKRTMMVNDNGTCLLVEGMGFEIVDDSTWKKPDEVRQEIGGLYLKFYSEQGCEPHYADCVIRWCDTLETVEVRIALAMDSDTEKVGRILLLPDASISEYTKNCYKQLKITGYENQMSGTLRQGGGIRQKYW